MSLNLAKTLEQYCISITQNTKSTNIQVQTEY